jgi:hypothetical protein
MSGHSVFIFVAISLPFSLRQEFDMTKPMRLGPQTGKTRLAIISGPVHSPVPWHMANGAYPAFDHLGYPTLHDALAALRKGQVDVLLVSAHSPVPTADFNDLDLVEMRRMRMPRIGLALNDEPSKLNRQTLFHAGRRNFLAQLTPFSFITTQDLPTDEDAIDAMRNQRVPSGAIVNELSARQFGYPLFRTLREEYAAVWVLYQLASPQW